MNNLSRIRAALASALLTASLLVPAACGNDNQRTDRAVADEPLPSLVDDQGAMTQVVPNDNAPAPAAEPVAEPPAPEPAPDPLAGMETRELIAKGRKLSGKREHAAAIEHLAEALDRSPNSARANIEMARAQLAAGDARAARPFAELAVELAPESSYAWNTMGRVELMDADREAAIEAFERATDANEDNIYAWNNLGLALIQEQAWADAAEALEVATGGDAPTAYMWNNLGLAYEKLDRLEEARAAYRQAADRGSDLGKAGVARIDELIAVPATVAEEAID
jgi:tetratricopeptide (TPR) repeat protein